MTYNEYETQISNMNSLLSDFVKTLNESYAPMFDEIRKVMAPALKIYADTLNQTLKQFGPELSKIMESLEVYKFISKELIEAYRTIDYSTLLKSITDIQVQEDYVSIPENLIPGDFQYEEVDSAPFIDPSASGNRPSVKHLSPKNTLALLAVLVPFICWVITSIRTDISSLQEQRLQTEIIATQKEANRLLEEEIQIQRKQLESAERSLEYMCTTYNLVQESHSDLLDIDSNSQYAHLQSETVDSANSTESSDSERIDDETNSSEPY